MKSKILLVLFLGILTSQAQIVKKTIVSKKPVTSVKSLKPQPSEGVFATILTNKGTIVVQLEYQKAPITVANFVSLAEGTNTFVTKEKQKGKPFYDGLKFHRVIKDFMIQGGDPDGNGSGGCGFAFKDEFSDLKFDKGGILAMANSGPATNGSQFFITHKDTPWLNMKHTIFGHVVQGMDIVNLVAQNDVILKVTITRKGTLAKQFDAPKVFTNYYANRDEEAKKQALNDAENQKKKAEMEAVAKKAYLEKYASVISAKAAYLKETKATTTVTPSGLAYKILQKGTGVKPADGTTFYFNYAGYFEDGILFDSSYEDISKLCGKYDGNRAAQNGYRAFPFEAGKKDGMIPGFLEGLGLMTFGDKAIIYIPANLAYGERGAGDVIPPNTNLIFELEMIEKVAEPKK